MLPRTTIRKILRETIASPEDGELTRQQPSLEQLLRLQELAADLSQIGRVEADVRDDQYLAMKIREEEHSGQNLEWFLIHFATLRQDGRTVLCLSDATYRRRRNGDTIAVVQDVENLKPFLEAIKAKQDSIRLRQERKSKLTDLRKKGLISQLTDLADEHGFSFSMGGNRRDVHLSIRVCGKKTPYHLSFPIGKLDDVLEQVPDLVRTLEQLRMLGIKFRNNNKPWALGQGKWIGPDIEN